MKRATGILILIAGITVAYAEAGATTIEAANELQKKGNLKIAFQRYLSIPGAEHAAASLARPNPETYLTILETTTNTAPPIQQLIEAELLLARGDEAAALERYREAVALIGRDDQTEWTEGRAPFNYYFVEPPLPSSNLAEPFQLGPGSHRDNWLIRRFIALDAMDDAEREFERIWALYRKAKEPRVQLLPVHDLFITGTTTNKLYLMSPAGYDGRGLQFAVDYAYFLSQRDKQEQARTLLMEPLRAMDMDINPDLSTPLTALSEEAAAEYPKGRLIIPSYRHYSWNPQTVLSRNDFIRLAYGEFKNAGREQELIEALEEQIAQGKVRARRVLARVLLLQNKPDEALKQELAYITEKGFPPFTTAYRRGMVYEEHQQPLKAAAEYEELLGLTPSDSVSLPDPEREPSPRMVHSEDWTDPNAHWVRMKNTDVVDRLKRIYVAQGKTDQLLTLTLTQLEVVPEMRSDFNQIQDAAKRFRAAGRTQDYMTWAREQIGKNSDPIVKANLYWSINERDSALAALGVCENVRDLDWWKTRFKERDRLIRLYDLILALDPMDSGTRVTRLNMENNPLPASAIDNLEILLAPDAPSPVRHQQFTGYHDLAYRLMRLYEKEDRIDALQALGLRVAEGDKPFIPLGKIDRDDYFFRNEDRGWVTDLQGGLSLLIHHADTATLDRLETTWNALPDFPSKQQLVRKQRGGFATESAPPIPWANLPAGVEALASAENVLSLAADESYVYSGHPWGVAVYDHEGKPVVRVALGAAANHIEPHAGHIWVGSPLGLWRIEPETWQVAHLPMDQDIPPKRRTAEYVQPNNRVHSLAADGDALWIGTRRDIRRLDLVKKEMRVFAPRELDVKSRDWNRVLVEEKYVWFTGYDASLRYDRKTGAWNKLELNGMPAFIIGAIDGTLWGHVHVGEPLRDRPCKIDRATLAVSPILIQGTQNESQRCINGPFEYYGTLLGDMVFATSQHQYLFNAEAGHLVPIDRDTFLREIESELPAALRRTDVWRDSRQNWHGRYTSRGTIADVSFHSAKWTLLNLPNGTRVLGGQRDQSPDYNHTRTDYPYNNNREPSARSGGLLFIPRGDAPHRVSSPKAANAIASDTVFAVTPSADNEHLWLCGNAGVSVLGRDLATRENVRRENGARASRVTSAAVVGDQTYFSLDAWGKYGGVMIHDAKSNVFTVLTTPDGLATARLARVEVVDGILFAEYREPSKGGSSFAQYDPASNTFAASAKPPGSSPDRPWKRRWDEPPLPGYDTVLGGSVVSTSRVDDVTLYCGTRGVVIAGDKRPAANAPDLFAVTVVLNDSARLRAEAEEMERNISPKTLEQLKKWMEHPNPFVRGMAFRSVEYQKPIQNSPELPVLVAAHAANSEPFLRKNALQTLTRSTHDAASIPIFQHALSDPEREIRYIATIALCERGAVPNADYLAEILERAQNGAPVERLNKAIAPHATPEVFTALMKWPPRYENYEYAEMVFPALGASLVRHPEAADTLLTAYETDKFNPRQRDFSLHVFQFTGTNLLAKLHGSLKSGDRVIRSNAARACGAIGNPSSIAPLLAAMDLDSGLSRASIVWALGELKAKAARPMLETLYLDIRNDEERAWHAGYRSGQRAAAVSTQYASMRNIESVGKEWNELNASIAPKPIQPRENEDLLSTQHILEAIGKIDPAAAQGFYRTLVSDQRADIRRVAAVQLARAEGPDRAANIPTLRALLADHDEKTRSAAAVSLLVLGDTSAESHILERLCGDDYSIQFDTLKQLQRVEQIERLAFARSVIEEIARDDETTALTNRAQEFLKRLE